MSLSPLTELHNLTSRKIASFLHYYDLNVNCIYKVKWENSKGFWRPCLKCMKFDFVEGYESHEHQGGTGQYYDFIRGDIEVLRMTDLIRMDLESYEKGMD